MNPTGLFDRLDDRINPIVVKELRQAVKSRLVVSALLLLLLLQVVILGIFLMFKEIRQPDAVDYDAGRTIFLTLQGIMMGVCMLLIPAYAGIRLAAERSDTNVDLLFISTLKPRSIVWGKFLAAVVLVLMIFSACAPFLTFTYLLRGIDIPSILLVLGIDLLTVLFGTMLAIFVASVPSNLGLKVVLFLVAFFVLLSLFYSAMGTSVMFLESGAARLDRPEFWATFAATVTAVLALMGLFFVWAVALVSPTSSNRALRVRVYTLLIWLVMGVAAVWTTHSVKVPGPIYVWQSLMLVLFGLQLVVSINERDHWGPRVARTIPRNRLLRAVAFVFFSGAAGGLLYGVLMLGLTIGLGAMAVSWWKARFPTMVGTESTQTAKIMILIGLYILAYALSAVLCRRAFFGERLKAVHTWVLFAILVALGSAVPYLFILTIPENSLNFERDNTWVILTNPVIAIIAAADPPKHTSIPDFDWLCLAFAASWSVGVTLVNMPWLVRQVRDFRPPSRPAGGKVPVVTPLPAAAALPNGDGPHVPPDAVTPPAPIQEAPAPEPSA